MESMVQTTAPTNVWASRALGLLKRCLWRGPSGQPDRRLSQRLELHFEAKILSQSGWMRARGVNLHAEGAMVVASRPLKPRSVVFVRLKGLGLIGFAHVRHSTERWLWGYAIGLAFGAPLMREEVGRWQFQQVHQTDVEEASMKRW